ncbi:MAG: RNA recognition motif domain-containing protein [Waddliaceae bacterium]
MANNKKLYVGNWPHDLDNNDLKDTFRPYGEVESAQIIMDRDTGRSKGFGFVKMGNEAEAQAAIDGLNGTEVGGRAINVNEARPQVDRGGRGGGGRRY